MSSGFKWFMFILMHKQTTYIYLLFKSQKPFFLGTHLPLGQSLWDRQELYEK